MWSGKGSIKFINCPLKHYLTQWFYQSLPTKHYSYSEPFLDFPLRSQIICDWTIQTSPSPPKDGLTSVLLISRWGVDEVGLRGRWDLNEVFHFEFACNDSTRSRKWVPDIFQNMLLNIFILRHSSYSRCSRGIGQFFLFFCVIGGKEVTGTPPTPYRAGYVRLYLQANFIRAKKRRTRAIASRPQYSHNRGWVIEIR